MKAIFTTYFEINILLIAAFLTFRFCRTLIDRFGVRSTYLSLTRLAQLLFLFSILIPMSFALIPERKMPRLSFEAAPPLAESTGVSRRKQVGQVPPQTFPHRESHPTQKSLVNLFETFETSRPEIFILLLCGVIWMAFRLAKNIFAIKQILAKGVVTRHLGRVSVLVSDSIFIPFSTLIGSRAYVVLPETILGDAKETSLAIRHEIQHHRQFDTAWALWIEIWICALFANPFVYLWKKEISELQEFSCDEALIGQRGVSPHEYGRCLIKVAEAALGSRQMLVGTACMASATKNPRDLKSLLGRRINMFTVHESAQRKRSVAIVFGTLGLITMTTVAFGAQQVLRTPPRAQLNPGVAVFDPATQAIAEDVLSRAVHSLKAKAGFVLVSDPLTGKLLAAANVSTVPTKEKSWSLSYALEPASVMKGITAAYAVESKVTTFGESLNCENGIYTYGHNQIHDWKPFGRLTTGDTVVQSSNICGIKIGERLGASGLAKMVHDFGFGPGGTTENFPEARSGDIPTVDQLNEQEYVALIGTGYTVEDQFHVTPLEMIQAYGAIANGGKLMKPLPANALASSAVVVRRVLSPETSQGMKQVLQKVVQDGTGWRAQSRIYTTAGKTGTAYTPGAPDHNSLGGERSIASFAGFAPVGDPRVTIYVGIINPTQGADHEPRGGEQAAPVFREVAERVLQQLHVAPDKGK